MAFEFEKVLIDRQSLAASLNDFVEELKKPKTLGFFVYCGHGSQYTDVKEEDGRGEAIGIGSVPDTFLTEVLGSIHASRGVVVATTCIALANSSSERPA